MVYLGVMNRTLFLYSLLFAGFSFGLTAQAADNPAVSPSTEALLLNSLQQIGSTKTGDAEASLLALTKQQPDFKLAQLVYGDMLAARGAPLSNVGSRLSADSEVSSLISEAKARVQAQLEHPGLERLPESLLQMAPNESHVIVVDTRLSRLFLFENDQGIPRLVSDFYASYGRGGVGKKRSGDLKTPLGVYFTTRYIPASKLPSRYGSGAYPINYPNVLDQRLGNTGNGIWIHGSPKDTYSRAPLASEGCVSLTNPDFETLNQQVDLKNTPVIIGNGIRWVEPRQWLARQAEFKALVMSWKKDWESLDIDRYLSHYSEGYSDGKRGLKEFIAHKKRVNRNKTYINVQLENLSLYQHPVDSNMLVATFLQHYKSNNYQGAALKRQYWKKEQGAWKILYEGAPSQGRP